MFGSKFFVKVLKILPDSQYLRLKYFIRTKKFLHLKNPKTFNEKLQWLKLNNRKDIYTTMVDKYGVREYVTQKIGEGYLIPLLGVWDSFDEIDFEKLPNKFVLKCTHDSGGLVFCNDKSNFDIDAARKKIIPTLSKNYFWYSREWPYKNVKPRIIAEEFIEEKFVPESESLVVYKVFCFNGEPKILQVIQNDKKPTEVIDYYDTNWTLLDMRQNYPNSGRKLEKSELFDKMLELSKKLSENIPFVRVDWYIPDGKLLFSEHTFFSDGGFAKFEPEKWDEILGSYIQL